MDYTLLITSNNELLIIAWTIIFMSVDKAFILLKSAITLIDTSVMEVTLYLSTI